METHFSLTTSTGEPFDLVNDYRNVLERLTVQNLRALAERRGIALSGNRREPILDTLAQGLAQPDNIVQALQKLSIQGRRTLDLLVIMCSPGDKLPTQQFLATFAYLQKAAPDKTPADPEAPLTELEEAGLAFWSDYNIALPAVVHLLLPGGSSWVEAHAGKHPLIRSNAPADFLRLALRLLLQAQAGGVIANPVSGERYWGGWPASNMIDRGGERTSGLEPPYLDKQELNRLAGETGQTPVQIDYLARLLEFAQLWKRGKSDRLEVTSNLTRFLALDQPSQLYKLATAAQMLTSWTELDWARQNTKIDLKFSAYYRSNYTDFLMRYAYARAAFLRLVSLLPVGVWVDVQTLLRIQHTLALDYFTERSTSIYWLEKDHRKVDAKNFAAWLESYGRFYTAILTRITTWFGICETALDGERLVAVRLTPLGAFLLSRGPLTAESRNLFRPPEESALSYPGGMRVIIDPALAPNELLGLLPILGELQTGSTVAPLQKEQKAGIRKSSRKGGLQYELTPAGATRAFELGWTAEDILSLLSEAAGKNGPACPKELAQHLRSWHQRFGRLHVYEELALIEFADDFALAELQAGTRLGRHLLYVFGPRLAAVRPESVDELLEELKLKGYTPRVAAPEKSARQKGGQR